MFASWSNRPPFEMTLHAICVTNRSVTSRGRNKFGQVGVMLGRHISQQAQHLVMLERRFSWQAKHVVKFWKILSRCSYSSRGTDLVSSVGVPLGGAFKK